MTETQQEDTGGPDPSRPRLRRVRPFWVIALLTALIALLLVRSLSTPPATMLISSGDPGDPYYLVGAVLDDILEDAFPGFPHGRNVDFTNLRSMGAVENVMRIAMGKAQLGLAEEGIEVNTMPSHAPGGAYPKGDSSVQAEVRTLARLFSSPLKIVVRRDMALGNARSAGRTESLGDLRPLMDLRRMRQERPLRAFIGAEGSGTRKVARLVLDHYGFTLQPASQAVPGADLLIVGDNWSFEQAKRGLEENEIDVAIFLTAFGSGAVRDLAGKGHFALLGIDRAAGIHRSHPFLDIVGIPASSYPAPGRFPDRDIETVAVDEVLIGSSALSEREAYRIVATLFNHSHDLASAFPFMVPLTKSDQLAQRLYYPPHPGATAFYQERPEPQGLVDFLQRYRDVMLALFSFGGSAWAILHFWAGRWRSRPLISNLRRSPSESQIFAIEHDASLLYAKGKINKETYESLKEYVRVRLNELNRRQ
jgi:TRAP-type uncharacterized transport system substrate-binding protein